MEAIPALLPILVVLILMVVFRWSSALAGLAGWAAGLIVALLAFGLNLQVLWVSQVKGLLLTLNVILLLWPGILLYNLVDQVGGIQAIARAFQGLVRDHGWLLVPGGLPKKELPKHQAETRWGRCAVLKDTAHGTPLTFGWDWCKDVQVAFAPGVSSFIAGPTTRTAA